MRIVRLLSMAAAVATSVGVLVGPAAAAQPPSTPVLTSMTPGDGQVSIAWQPSSSEAPDTLDYLVDVRTMADDLLSETSTTQPSYVATGLTNGTEYRIDVTPQDSVGTGEPLHVTVRPGRVPDQPALTSTPAPDTIHVDASAIDYGYTPSWTFRLMSRVGGAPDIVIESSQPVLEYPDYDRIGYTVTAVATNYFGDSIASAPIVARPLTLPGAPRQVWWSRHGERYTVHWLPPRDDGGLPITRYRIDLGPHHVYFAAATARSLLLPTLPANRAFSVQVYARNALGRTEIPHYSAASLATDIGVLTSVDAAGHGRWRWTTSNRWHGLGGGLDGPPGVARAAGRVWFVAATKTGVLVIRHLTGSWHVLSSSNRCHRVTVGNLDGNGLEIYCLGLDRRVVTAMLETSQLRSGWPRLLDAQWETLNPPAGLRDFTAARNETITMAMRVSPFDAAGHNVRAAHPFPTPGWDKVPLACPATPAVTAGGSGYVIACATDAHHVVWVDSAAPRRPKRIATPAAVRLALGAVSFRDGFTQITAVGRDGRVWLLDVAQRRWWAQGRSSTAPVRVWRPVW